MTYFPFCPDSITFDLFAKFTSAHFASNFRVVSAKQRSFALAVDVVFKKFLGELSSRSFQNVLI